VVSADVRDSHGTAAGSPSTAQFVLSGLSGSILTVNSTADTASDSDPYLSLREAISIVNSPTLPTDLSPEIQAQISGTLHANGSDAIVFDPASVTGPIILGGTQLELSLSRSTAAVTIDGGSGVTVDGNDASRVFQVDAGVQANLAHLTITHGHANGLDINSSSGGGIFSFGTLTVSGCTLTANSATGTGGALGGAIYSSGGILTVSNSTLSGNSATSGGGILSAGTLTVSNSNLSGNSVTQAGGALFTGGTATVTNSTLSGNSATHIGGGIYMNSSATLINSTLVGNVAGDGGGGIQNSGTLTVINSTLAGNTAAGPSGQGGGISSAFALTVSNSTLSGNSAQRGGGIYNPPADGSPLLQSSIVTGNQTGGGTDSGPDVFASLDSSSSYNLIGIGDGSLSGISGGSQGNQVGTADSPIDPLLAPLGYYGGPTQTYALLPGSPALGAGDPSTPQTTDQRGLPRLVNGLADIGAFQTQADPFLVTTLTDPGRQFGLLSLREAVNLANALPGDNTVSFSTSFDFGTVTLTQGLLELAGAPGVRTIDGGYRITINGNHASSLFLVDAGVQAVLTRLDLANGSSDSGGGIFNSGNLTLAYCTLYGNAAIYGGAVCNVGTLTVYGTTFGYDFSWYQGGGLFNAGTLTAFNDTFVYDTAFHDGGAIYTETGNATLTSLTISLNNSASGGGLAVAAGDVLLRNSIVAGNLNDTSTAASDIAGTLDASSSYNLIGTGGSGGLSDGVNHNHVGVADPGLTPPDFSTTLSPVFGFTSSSQALRAGDPTLLSDPLLSLDQHGNLRSSPPNIGAV
jgi:predicted outer membrane repeat protein